MKPIIVGLAALMLTSCMEAQAPHKVPDTAGTEFNIETLADGLGVPWSIAVLPDGTYLFTEQAGILSRIKPEGVEQISGLPEDIYAEGQGGLLGVVIGPDFESTGEIFLSYSQGTKKDNATAVYRAKFSGTTLENGSTIFRASPGKDTGSHFCLLYTSPSPRDA